MRDLMRVADLQPTVRRAVLLAMIVVACANKPGGDPVNRGDDQPGAGVAGAGDTAGNREVPPFEVEFRQISKFPTCLSNRRIRVDRGGGVFAAVNQTECPEGSDWSTPYPSEPQRRLDERARHRLWETIQTSGFLALPSRQDAKAEDGTVQEIDVIAAGKTHSVSMDNTDDPAFAAVRSALTDIAP
jgi:hypothetical protein